MRILLVEDNADHRELMSLALTEHDPTWQVKGVAFGEEALRHLAEEEAYDLVFLDYMLPERNGLQVLEQIRRGEAPPQVVIVTGLGDEQVAVEAMKAGAYDYVVKQKGYLQRLPVVAERAVEAQQSALERKRAEEALRYQAYLLKNVSDAIISTDVNFNIKSWNKAAETMYGWQADKVIGKQMSDATKMQYAPGEREALIKELFEQGYWKGEAVQRRKDGTPINILASVSLLKDNAGNPVGAVAVNRDITERKRAEEALREQMRQVERLNELFVGREHHLIELKREVNSLLEKLGQAPKYEAPAQMDELTKEFEEKTGRTNGIDIQASSPSRT